MSSSASATWQSVLNLLDDGNAWSKEGFTNLSHTKFCLLGACGQAWTKDPTAPQWAIWRSKYEYQLRTLADRLPQTIDPIDPHTALLEDVYILIFSWNDLPTTTWEDINDVLSSLLDESAKLQS